MSASTGSARGGRVLIVDDNPQNLKLLRILLSGKGYELTTAVDAEEALRTVESFRPHVILMDLQLPRMDGLELTRTLKADPGGGDGHHRRHGVRDGSREGHRGRVRQST